MNGYQKKFDKANPPNAFWDEPNVISEYTDLTLVQQRPVLHGEMEINGIRLAISPSSISISEQNFNHSYQTLRTRESTKVRSGYSRTSVSFSAYFTGVNRLGISEEFGDRRSSSLGTINGTLMPLLYSFKKFPLCFVENELIRRALPVQYAERTWTDPDTGAQHKYITGEVIGMFVRSATVSTVDGLPETLMGNFELVWYNHRPFAHRLMFRRDWVDKEGRLLDIKGIYETLNEGAANTNFGKATLNNKGKDSDDISYKHVGRNDFLDKYGHPSVAFNATARNNYTYKISESRPFLEWMWPYKFESTNPASPKGVRRSYSVKEFPFNLESFNTNYAFEFTIIESPQVVTIDGQEISVHEIFRDINVGSEIEDVANPETALSERTVKGLKARLRQAKELWLDDAIEAARAANVDPNIVISIVAMESAGRSSAVGPTLKNGDQAYGLMQITSGTALGYQVYTSQDLLDPKTNLNTGAKIVAARLKAAKGDLSEALWAYHRGEGNRAKEKEALALSGLPTGTPAILTKEQIDALPERLKQAGRNLEKTTQYREALNVVYMEQTGKPIYTADSLGGTATLNSSVLPIKTERALQLVNNYISNRSSTINSSYYFPSATDQANEIKAKALKEVLDRMTAQNSRLEINIITGKVAEIKTVVLEIPSHGSAVIPLAMNVGFGNNLVTTPLQGHRFPTVQYVGGQHTAVTTTLRCEGQAGRDFYADLVSLTAAAEASAISFREFAKKRPIGIRNPLANSMNIYEVLIEDMQMNTVPGNPDAIVVDLNMIDATLNAELSPLLVKGKQETAVEDVQIKLLSLLMNRGWITYDSVPINVTRSSGVSYSRGGNAIQTFEAVERKIFKFGDGSPAYLSPAVKDVIRILGEELTSASEDFPGVSDEVLENTEGISYVQNSALGVKVSNYVAPISGPTGYGGLKLLGDIPYNPSVVYSLIGTATEPGALSSSRAKVALSIALERIIGLLGIPVDGNPAQDAEIAQLVQDLSAPLAFVPGHEAYPDLALPPNPITGLNLDTTPDFFLYNESDVKYCNSNILDIITGENERGPKKKGLFAALKAIEGTHQGIQQVYGIIPKSELQPGEVGDVGLGADEDYLKSNRGQYTTNTKVLNYKFRSPLNNEDWATSFVSGNDITPPLMGSDIDVRARGVSVYKGYKQKESRLFNYQNKDIPGITDGKFSTNANTMKHLFERDEYKRVVSEFTSGYQGDHLSIRRSFPTFKVFFIDEEGEVSANSDTKIDSKLFRAIALDDFYGVNAIKSIRVIEQKDMAASSCIIEVLDIDGILYNRKYLPEPSTFGLRDSKARSLRSPFSNTVIKEGMKVMVKFGFSNDPDQLETMFIGQIAQFEGNQLVEIICQSYGTELVAKKFGSAPNENASAWNSSTAELLHDCMDREELRHFGRWKLEDVKLIGLTGFIGYQKLRPDGQTKTSWTWKPSVVDDNLYIPDISQYLGKWDRFWGNLEYCYWDTTTWEVFKECELRHPGYVAYPKIYGNSPLAARMTMFFGNPSMEYLSRPASTVAEMQGEISGNNVSEVDLRSSVVFYGAVMGTALGGGLTEEEAYVKGLEALSNSNLGAMSAVAQNHSKWRAYRQAGQHIKRLSIIQPYAKQILRSIRSASIDSEGYAIDIKDIPKNKFWRSTMVFQNSRMKIFRGYELVTSLTDIVSNNIRCDHRDTFNSIELRYSDGKLDFEEFYGEGTAEVITVNADDNIQEHHIRRGMESWVNCTTSDLARRYSAQLLANSLKRTYKGEIILMGKPKIRPYDILWIADSYSDMAGPIEVDEVVHSFTAETGFTTEVVPAMIVAVKEEVTTLMSDAMGTFFGETIKDFTDGFTIGSSIVGIAGFGRALALTRTRAAAVLTEKEAAAAALRTESKDLLSGVKSAYNQNPGLKTVSGAPLDYGTPLGKEAAKVASALEKAKTLRKSAAALEAEVKAAREAGLAIGSDTVPETLGSIAVGGAALLPTVVAPNINERDPNNSSTGLTQKEVGFLSGAGVGALAMVNPLFAGAAIATAGLLAYKFVKSGLMREPIIITPLIKQGKPFVTGIDGFESDGLVIADLFGDDTRKKAKAKDVFIYKKWRYFGRNLQDAADIASVGWARFTQSW